MHFRCGVYAVVFWAPDTWKYLSICSLKTKQLFVWSCIFKVMTLTWSTWTGFLGLATYHGRRCHKLRRCEEAFLVDVSLCMQRQSYRCKWGFSYKDWSRRKTDQSMSAWRTEYKHWLGLEKKIQIGRRSSLRTKRTFLFITGYFFRSLVTGFEFKNKKPGVELYVCSNRWQVPLFASVSNLEHKFILVNYGYWIIQNEISLDKNENYKKWKIYQTENHWEKNWMKYKPGLKYNS